MNQDLKKFLDLSDRELLSYCYNDKNGDLCDNEKFWELRTKKYFGYIDKNPKRTWKNLYLKIVKNNDLQSPVKSVLEFSRGGYKNLDLIMFFLSKISQSDVIRHTLNDAMYIAIALNDQDLIDFLLSEGAEHWYYYVIKATDLNRNELAKEFSEKYKKLLIELNETPDSSDFNIPLLIAIYNGNLELVKFFYDPKMSTNNNIIDAAMFSGNKNVQDYLSSKEVDFYYGRTEFPRKKLSNRDYFKKLLGGQSSILDLLSSRI